MFLSQSDISILHQYTDLALHPWLVCSIVLSRIVPCFLVLSISLALDGVSIANSGYPSSYLRFWSARGFLPLKFGTGFLGSIPLLRGNFSYSLILQNYWRKIVYLFFWRFWQYDSCSTECFFLCNPSANLPDFLASPNKAYHQEVSNLIIKSLWFRESHKTFQNFQFQGYMVASNTREHREVLL